MADSRATAHATCAGFAGSGTARGSRERHRSPLPPGSALRLAAATLVLLLSPWATAQFVSVCGSAPSGTNDCPWYHVEIIVFRNDTGAGSSAEALEADALPRWTTRLATLRPPLGEPLRPIHTSELSALWQSAGEAPEWFIVQPGLTFGQERFLSAIDGIGRARHPLDLGFLRDLDGLVWQEIEAPAPDPVDQDGIAPPPLEPIVIVTRPDDEADPELPPEVEDLPEIIGIIPMDLAFRELSAADRILEAEAARLRRARGFEVLAHLAWRQPFRRDEPGLAQLIVTREPADPGLSEGERLLGTVTIDLRRFLHAHLDLYYRPRQALPPAGIEGVEWNGATESRFIHIRQSRRMRSGELHYLDHPQIGAIIRIERFELADTD